MDERTALHTAARRYSIERIEQGDERYQRVKDFKMLPPQGAHDIAVRNVHVYILPCIERVVAADFATTDDLRAYVMTCAQTAPIPDPTAGSTPERE